MQCHAQLGCDDWLLELRFWCSGRVAVMTKDTDGAADCGSAAILLWAVAGGFSDPCSRWLAVAGESMAQFDAGRDAGVAQAAVGSWLLHLGCFPLQDYAASAEDLCIVILVTASIGGGKCPCLLMAASSLR